MGKILTSVLNGTPPVLKGYSIFTNAIQLMVKQRNALIKDNWEKLENLANQGTGMAYGNHREIYRSVGILQAQVEEANEALSAFLIFNAKNKETRKEFYAEVKKRLLKTNPNLSSDWLEALDALKEGDTKDNVILNGLKKKEAEIPDMVESAIEATVALAIRSLMALTFSGFHNHYKQVSKYPFISHADDLIITIQGEIKKFETELENRLKILHKNIIDGVSIQASCEDIIFVLEQSLPAFGRLQATISHYALALKNGKKAVFSEKAGKLAALAGDLTRTAFASYASAYYLSLQSLTTNKNPKLKKILQPEPKLKYDIDIPKGKYTEISKVGDAENGDFIEVRGFVESIITRRDSDQKLLSKITLSDTSSNTRVEAVGIFVHFRHVGLLEGTYCTLSGVLKSKSKINENKQAIEIDKISINELSEKSWKIRFLDIADQFYNRWPGNLNINFGLSPHISKIKKGKESKTLGAGELIFKPFIN